MRKILMGTLAATLALGFIAGALILPQTPALALYCDHSDGTFYITREVSICPDYYDNLGRLVDMIAQYRCEGRVLGTMKPCDCVFIGCIVDPYSRPANQNMQ